MKFCILYWGLIRGFKYDVAYSSHHKELYSILENNNIDFDVFVVTNRMTYDDKCLKHLPKLKKVLLLDELEIMENKTFKKCLSKMKLPSYFTLTHKINLMTCYYNREEILRYIDSNYDLYICLDIGQIINSLQIENVIKFDFNKNILITSKFGKSGGMNPRVSISNYNVFKLYNSIFSHIMVSDLNTKKMININQLLIDPDANYHPESGIYNFLIGNEIDIITIPILLSRIRENGEIIIDQVN